MLRTAARSLRWHSGAAAQQQLACWGGPPASCFASAAAAESSIVVSQQGATAVIELNRPKQMNALSMQARATGLSSCACSAHTLSTHAPPSSQARPCTRPWQRR